MVIRKIKDNEYIIDNLEWIRIQLLKRCGVLDDGKMSITMDDSNYGRTGYVLFSLCGNPPRGCAVLDDRRKFIVFISIRGKTKTYNNTYMGTERLAKLKKLHGSKKDTRKESAEPSRQSRAGQNPTTFQRKEKQNE